MVKKAGANGSGLRISPDGERVSYLSFVGFPEHSKNISAWDAAELPAKPVTYACADNGATCQEIAFHPTLKLVAIPGKGSAVIFDRETGQLQPDRLVLSSKGLGSSTVESLTFSPDGANLIFVCTEPGQPRYLRQVPLKLGPQERAIASKGRPDVKQAPASRKPAIIGFKLSELESLTAKSRGAMGPKEISKQYDGAVVLVEAGDRGGSGFVIGSKGYAITCAHVVGGVGDEAQVTYAVPGQNEKTAVASAKVIAADPDRDIALLKFEPTRALPFVVLGGTDSVDAGEGVIVIGNPGAGDRVLTHTMTTGIVSNPKRDLDGEFYIQTSAAVNPGSSGGPMFDSKGEVIGLVCLKANIEGAAFALPTSEIRRFVKAASEAH